MQSFEPGKKSQLNGNWYVVASKLADIGVVSQWADYIQPSVTKYKYIAEYFFVECKNELLAQQRVTLIPESQITQVVVQRAECSGNRRGSFAIDSIGTKAPVFFQVTLREGAEIHQNNTVDPNDLTFTAIRVIKKDGPKTWAQLDPENNRIELNIGEYEGDYPRHFDQIKENSWSCCIF